MERWGLPFNHTQWRKEVWVNLGTAFGVTQEVRNIARNEHNGSNIHWLILLLPVLCIPTITNQTTSGPETEQRDSQQLAGDTEAAVPGAREGKRSETEVGGDGQRGTEKPQLDVPSSPRAIATAMDRDFQRRQAISQRSLNPIVVSTRFFNTHIPAVL